MTIVFELDEGTGCWLAYQLISEIGPIFDDGGLERFTCLPISGTSSSIVFIIHDCSIFVKLCKFVNNYLFQNVQGIEHSFRWPNAPIRSILQLATVLITLNNVFIAHDILKNYLAQHKIPSAKCINSSTGCWVVSFLLFDWSHFKAVTIPGRFLWDA